MPVATAWHAFGRIETHEIAPRNAVKHAPNLGLRIGAQIGWCRPAFRTAIEVEPQPVALDPSRSPFEREHAAPLAERAVVHVRAEGKIPDLVLRSAVEPDAVVTIAAPRQQPRPRNPMAPADHGSATPAFNLEQPTNGQYLQQDSRTARGKNRGVGNRLGECGREYRQYRRWSDKSVEIAAVGGPPLVGRDLHQIAEHSDRSTIPGSAEQREDDNEPRQGVGVSPAPHRCDPTERQDRRNNPERCGNGEQARLAESISPPAPERV